MHGILFKYLKEYVESEHGEDAWEAAMDEAGIEPKLYLPVTDYPDDEARDLLDGIVTVTGVDRADLLEDYGRALAPELLDTFEAHVRDDWGYLDLLEHPDNEVFEVFYSEDGGDDELVTTRDGDAVTVQYASAMETCELAKGVLRGLGAAHGEDVAVREGRCMHDGADHCEITVDRA